MRAGGFGLGQGRRYFVGWGAFLAGRFFGELGFGVLLRAVCGTWCFLGARGVGVKGGLGCI